MNYKQEILKHTIPYLEKYWNIEFKHTPITATSNCPICKQLNSLIYSKKSNLFRCFNSNCEVKTDTPLTFIKKLFNKEIDELDIIQDIKEKLSLDIETVRDREKYLDIFESNKFDLVPVARDGKQPIEKDWPLKIHKDKSEWKAWLSYGNNIGIKTGLASNITVIDIDTKEIPEVISKYKPLETTMCQITTKGYHFIYKYEKELSTTRIDELKIDILNDKKQFVCYPSIVEGVKRQFINNPIQQMPEEIKNFILNKTSFIPKKTLSEYIKTDLQTENFNIPLIAEGNRNNVFIHFGGILRKYLNRDQTATTLRLFNKHFCSHPLSITELERNIIDQLDRYTYIDEAETSKVILQYIRTIEEATALDIKDALGFKREVIDTCLAYLMKEGYIIRHKKNYKPVKKVEWKEAFVSLSGLINYKMPYFHDYAVFRSGDMIVIGGKTGTGKSIHSMNLIKRLVEQGIKPYYISTESNNRFSIIAQELGMVEGNFYYDIVPRVDGIVLPENSITILDWLLPKDYAETDKIFEALGNEIKSKGGILIVFVQLRDDGSFYAKDMINFFPSFSAKFLYEGNDNLNSYFETVKIRESKIGTQYTKIPLRYNYLTKELQLVSEVENEKRT